MSASALLILDMINDLEFPDGHLLLEQTLPIVRPLRALRGRCRRLGWPVIYCNDNFGRWRSDFKKLVRHCLKDGVRGEPLARALQPGVKDYFILKPRHSGFYATSLEPLLAYLGIKDLVITGVAADICVLFTAHDAHMREFKVSVPEDCVASNSLEQNRWALGHLRQVLDADTRPWQELKVLKGCI
jgi:nicotinamidase-related amidase